MNLTQSLHRHARISRERIATVFGARRRTYAQLRDRVARLAAGLRSLGVAADDRVGILMLNSDRYLETLYATYWAGGAVNPVNVRWSPDEIAYSLDDCDTRVLVVDDTFLPMVPQLAERSKSLQTLVHAGDGETPAGMISFEALVAQHEPAEDAMRGGRDLAGVFYTGGTTGFPKGVMNSHAGLYSNALGAVTDDIAAEGGVALHAAPMFHMADLVFFNASLMTGSTNVIIPAFDPVKVLDAIERERVTHALLVPTMIQLTVDHPELARRDISSLKFVVYGASPISEAVLDRAMQAFPTAGFIQAYGMTELSPIVTVLSAYWHSLEGCAKANKRRSAGRPNAVADLRVVDINDRTVPNGTVGEIVARGPGVMLGYWNKPEETATALRNGWMHTGDGGYMDDDGFVFIVDRVKDMIVTGGENVYSVEVENAVARHPAVAAVAVIGIPSDQWGEAVHAVIVSKPGAKPTADEIIAHCKALIASYKVPRSIEFVDALPMSGAGKVLKREIRKRFWEGQGRQVA